MVRVMRKDWNGRHIQGRGRVGLILKRNFKRYPIRAALSDTLGNSQ
jgi:hypothetical protein